MTHKIVFIARHGETNSNLTNTIQTHDEPLNENGIRQAAALGRRLSASKRRYPIEAIIASTMSRAAQTAAIVGQKLGIAVATSPHFIERLHPSSLRGHQEDEPLAKAVLDEMRAHFHDPYFDYGDGENFAKLHARALRARKYLEEHPVKCLLVITHGMFAGALLPTFLFGDALTSELLASAPMLFPNTGILKAEFTNFRSFDGSRDGWRITVADASHCR